MATETFESQEAVLRHLERIGDLLERSRNTIPLRERFGVSDAEAAELCGWSRAHFRCMVNRGLMPKPRKAGGRSVWIAEEVLAALRDLPQEK